MRVPAEVLLFADVELRAPDEDELLALLPPESSSAFERTGDLLDAPISSHLDARVDGS